MENLTKLAFADLNQFKVWSLYYKTLENWTEEFAKSSFNSVIVFCFRVHNLY